MLPPSHGVDESPACPVVQFLHESPSNPPAPVFGKPEGVSEVDVLANPVPVGVGVVSGGVVGVGVGVGVDDGVGVGEGVGVTVGMGVGVVVE